MARSVCLTALALAVAFTWVPGQTLAKKRAGATAKRCTVKKSPRPRACRARSYASWQLLREPRARGGLVDLGPRPGTPGAAGPSPTGTTGGGPGPVYSKFVSVTARDVPALSLTLSRPIVGAGQITVQLQNRGEDPHNLKLSTAAGQPPLTGIPDQDPGPVAEMGPTLGAGSYYLYCSLGDHESRGMRATLEVR